MSQGRAWQRPGCRNGEQPVKRGASAARGVVLMLAMLSLAQPASAQELGNKLLGAIGVNAGTQPEPGLYLLDRLVFYSAGQLHDRHGDRLPVKSLDVDVVANVLGLSFTVRHASNPYFTAAIGAPLAHIGVNADHPQLAVDESGFGDFFVQPLKLGARFERFDVVVSYTFYVPSGRFEPRRPSIGRGYWTNEFSLGGAFYADPKRTRRASLLASYDINGRKRGIDITRGNLFQVQGGAGARVAGPIDLGIAGFALWQVTDNRGAELPDIVRGARTRAFGLGPELGITLPAIRTRVDLRSEWEFGVRSRQEGWIFVASASFLTCCTMPPR